MYQSKIVSFVNALFLKLYYVNSKKGEFCKELEKKLENVLNPSLLAQTLSAN